MSLMGLCRIVSLIAFQRINNLHRAAIIWNQFSPLRLSGGFSWLCCQFCFQRTGTQAALFLFELNNKHCCVSHTKSNYGFWNFSCHFKIKKYFIYTLIVFVFQWISIAFHFWGGQVWIYDLLSSTLLVQQNKIKTRELWPYGEDI